VAKDCIKVAKQFTKQAKDRTKVAKQFTKQAKDVTTSGFTTLSNTIKTFHGTASKNLTFGCNSHTEGLL